VVVAISSAQAYPDRCYSPQVAALVALCAASGVMSAINNDSLSVADRAGGAAVYAPLSLYAHSSQLICSASHWAWAC
jgi:hypothetical protein